MNDNGLTDKEERYCQLRAEGKTKSGAARIAYDGDPQYANRMGYIVERREDVQARIQELKEERAEAYGLDFQEQVRRYNQLYQMALDKGQLATAAKMLERLDAIGGFEAPTKSVTYKGTLGGTLKDPNGNIEEDLKKFAGVLKPHSDKTSSGEITIAEDASEDSKGVIH
jgi:hypothetical protein